MDPPSVIDDVTWPIDAGSDAMTDTIRTFTVFGLTVSVDAMHTVFDGGAAFETLAEGQNVEVSGFFDGSRIVASRVEKQGDLDDEFEVKGTVAGYDGATIFLTLQNGVGAGPFTVSPAATLDIPADPAGRFVELALVVQGAGQIVTRIETEDEAAVADGEKVSIGGIVSGGSSVGLLVNGVLFSVDDTTRYEPAGLKGRLLTGMAVRIEGRIQDGVLRAGEIARGDGDIEIAARVVDVNRHGAKHGAVTVGLGNGQRLTVGTRNFTQFVDEGPADLDADASFGLDELLAGTDFVVIRAYQNDSTQLVATRIARAGEALETRLAASAASVVPGFSVSLLGVTWMVHSGTRYELNGADVGSANFFAALDAGDRVEVRVAEPDGTAQKLVLRDASDAPAPDPDPTPNPGPVTGLASIQFSFKLDPRLTQGLFLGERWVSPPVYTRVQEAGKPLTVDARVSGLDAGGRPLAVISPAWASSDPGLVSVSPAEGEQVLITVLGVGLSTLGVTARGVTSELTINAMPYLDNTLLVEISR